MKDISKEMQSRFRPFQRDVRPRSIWVQIFDSMKREVHGPLKEIIRNNTHQNVRDAVMSRQNRADAETINIQENTIQAIKDKMKG